MRDELEYLTLWCDYCKSDQHHTLEFKPDSIRVKCVKCEVAEIFGIVKATAI